MSRASKICISPASALNAIDSKIIFILEWKL